jgi:type II secretory pathway component GspD/PulD (secretin)
MAYVGPLSTTVRVQTSISVPDRGEALVGGYSSYREGRNQYGTPILSKAPYAKPLFNSVGHGRDVSRQTISVRVRIIDLREEEFRQTGVGRNAGGR